MIEEQIESTLKAMAKSQEQLARILNEEKKIVRRMAHLVSAISPEKLPTDDFDRAYPDTAKAMARIISSYLNGLADLEDALAEKVKYAVKELRITESE